MKTNIDFYKNRKKFFTLSLVIIGIGLIFNIIFGTRLDIKFTGGALIKYSYNGEIEANKVESIAHQSTDKDVTVELNESMSSQGSKSLTLSFAGTGSLPVSAQQNLTSDLLKEYPDGNFAIIESSSIDPSMGNSFFLKCLACIAITVLLLIGYISFRFKKIGGFLAGLTSVIALIHDIVIVYFTFIVFKMPLNDNFIAVVLTILGYSLNDTIVIYDRIRENKRMMGPTAQLKDVVNLSINQTLGRSIVTSLTTFMAIAIVFIVGLIYNLNTIITFALPMMVGVVVGCYSSICIASPLYVVWKEKKAAKSAAKSEK